MCAKQTQKDTGFQTEWVSEIRLDELRRPTSVVFTSSPGDKPGEMESAMLAVLAAAPPATAILTSSDLPTNEHASRLSHLVEPYIAFVATANNPNEKTLESYRAAIALFIEIVGDKSLPSLTIDDQNQFEDTVKQVPANRSKIASARGLSLTESLALNVPKLSLQTTKNIAQRTNNFLEWAFRRTGQKVPFELMNNVRVTARSKDVKRRAFSDMELSRLFNPTEFTAGRTRSPYMFWVPLIGLHTGMRINEIAQLEVADIVTRDAVICFNVTDQPSSDDNARASNKKIKTGAGRRIVPVHHALISLGLLDYVRDLNRLGQTRIFPDLSIGRDGPGQPASKHFARLCDRIGLTDPALVFHSFRHGAIGRMRAAGIPKETRMVVVGHSATEDTHDGYGDMQNDIGVGDRKLAVETLKFDTVLDYDSLRALTPTVGDIVKGLPT